MNDADYVDIIHPSLSGASSRDQGSAARPGGPSGRWGHAPLSATLTAGTAGRSTAGDLRPWTQSRIPPELGAGALRKRTGWCQISFRTKRAGLPPTRQPVGTGLETTLPAAT